MLTPYFRETIVSPLRSEEVFRLLDREIASKKENKLDRAFNGFCSMTEFRLSRKVSYPNNYLPLMNGVIEDSGKGSIINIRYKLFPSTQAFLIFWTSLSLFIGLFVFFGLDRHMYGSLAILAGIANYLVSLFNFRKQLQLSRSLLFSILDIGI